MPSLAETKHLDQRHQARCQTVTVDFKEFTPRASSWFSTSVEYSGHGRAEFADPPGVIEGPTKARFDEFGHSSIEMDIEKMEPDIGEPLRVMAFLHGSPPIVEGNKTTRFIGGRRNPCLKLTVSCEEGILLASNGIFYGCRDSFQGTGARLTFYITRTQFDAEKEHSPRYWVLPLANFLSQLRVSDRSLDLHPLRIYPTPIIPSDLPEKDAVHATLLANSKNHLIVFQFNGTLGFIEPLPDYVARERRLLAGQENHILTALMVGEVGSHSIDFANLELWFPFDFLPLLELATGSEIGAPWIEFRDAGGNLVRRMHGNLGRPPFTKGRRPIREEIHDGIGRLLTRATASPHWGKTYLRVVLRHLVRGGLSGLPMEDSLNHLSRALDALCEELGFKKTLKSKDVLGESNRIAIEKAISDAVKTIRDLANQADSEGNASKVEVLRRVADRIAQAKSLEIGFGKAVVALLKHFGFPDTDILARHYELNPRPDRRNWAEVVSMYRATSMHRGYFDFRDGKLEFDDVFRISEHLHDLILRIVFKLLDYDGTYQPTVAKSLVQARADWVTRSTAATELGY